MNEESLTTVPKHSMYTSRAHELVQSWYACMETLGRQIDRAPDRGTLMIVPISFAACSDDTDADLMVIAPQIHKQEVLPGYSADVQLGQERFARHSLRRGLCQ